MNLGGWNGWHKCITVLKFSLNGIDLIYDTYSDIKPRNKNTNVKYLKESYWSDFDLYHSFTSIKYSQKMLW